MGGKTGGAPRTSNDEGGGCEKEKLVKNGAGKDTKTLVHAGGREERRRGLSIQNHCIFQCRLFLTCEAIFQSAGVREPERGRHREENGWEEGAGAEKAGASLSSDSSMTRLRARRNEKGRGRLVRSEIQRETRKDARSLPLHPLAPSLSLFLPFLLLSPLHPPLLPPGPAPPLQESLRARRPYFRRIERDKLKHIKERGCIIC